MEVVRVSLAEAVTERGWSLNSRGILTGGILKTAFWALAVSWAAGVKISATVVRAASFQFKNDTSGGVPFNTVLYDGRVGSPFCFYWGDVVVWWLWVG